MNSSNFDHILSISIKDYSLATDSLSMSQNEQYAFVLDMLCQFEAESILQTTRLQLLRFIADADATYYQSLDVTYHHFAHAVDVVFMSYYILRYDFDTLDMTDKLLILIAALCHDSCHPGLNNLYHVNAHTDIASLTDNESVLEQLSASVCCKLAHKYFPDKLDDTTIKECILATDMSQHFDIKQELIDDMPLQKLTLMRAVLHAADISNPCRPFTIARKWSDMVTKEFYSQGDTERHLNITVSPNMDRPRLPQDQSQQMYLDKQVDMAIGFVEFVVQPFFESLLPHSNNQDVMYDIVDGIKSNNLRWLALKSVSPVQSENSEISFEEKLRTNNRRLSVAAGVLFIPDASKPHSYSQRTLRSREASRTLTKSSSRTSTDVNDSLPTMQINRRPSNEPLRRPSDNRRPSIEVPRRPSVGIRRPSLEHRLLKLTAVESGVVMPGGKDVYAKVGYDQIKARIIALPRLSQPFGYLSTIKKASPRSSQILDKTDALFGTADDISYF